MPRATKNRWPRAAKLADLLHRVQAHATTLKARIARLTPLPLLKAALLAGDISSEFFVQRLLDSGSSMEDAINDLGVLRHSVEKGVVAELNPEALRTLAEPPPRVIHRQRVPPVQTPSLPTHTPPPIK